MEAFCTVALHLWTQPQPNQNISTTNSLCYTYDRRSDAVSGNINWLDQSRLVESNLAVDTGQVLGTSVKAKGRGGGGEDGKKGKSGDLHLGCFSTE